MLENYISPTAMSFLFTVTSFLLMINFFVVTGLPDSLAAETSESSRIQLVDEGDESLLSLLNDYLETPDSALAEQLLNTILSRPDASIDHVANLFRSARSFEMAPVGHQPSQPIQIRGKDMSYGLFVPSNYDPSKAYPLVVCLHGAGFTGDSYLERWATRLGESYLLACPSISMGSWWSHFAEELVLATIREVQSRYHVDPDRLYLTGMSNGGIGAWIIGMHHAPRFAAVAPMAGGIDDVLFPFLRNLRETSLYVIHGAKDQIMPVWLSRNITNELAQLGIAYVYREHEWSHPHAGGHFFPRQELPALVEWFGAQRRDRYPKNVSVVRDASHLTDFGWVRIDSTDRIAMFSDQLIDSQDDLMKNRIYARMDVSVLEENRIEVTTSRVRRYTLFLNDALVDFSSPLTVVTNGVISFEGPIAPQLETMLREMRRRDDPSLLFPAKLTVDVPK